MHVDLYECARQLLGLPRRGLFAGAQAHDHILPADRLAGPQRDVLDDPVALVEDAEHGDALRHRGHSALPRRGCRRIRRHRRGCVLLLDAFAACGERQCKHQWCSE
jgi:hypothetical protein